MKTKALTWQVWLAGIILFALYASLWGAIWPFMVGLHILGIIVWAIITILDFWSPGKW